jgi:membrane-bound ClpP family serine protease
LHPTGVVEIDGERYEASVQVGTLSRGDAVKVVGYRNFYLLVAEGREA